MKIENAIWRLFITILLLAIYVTVLKIYYTKIQVPEIQVKPCTHQMYIEYMGKQYKLNEATNTYKYYLGIIDGTEEN